jgi:nucleotide-binding universal stress UspA family protein
MNRPAIEDLNPNATYDTPTIARLLFVADAAVADVDQLPPPVRGLIDAADEIYVVTPTLPGRLAWLADDVDRFRHVADERLDAVLGHMRSIGADVSGVAGRGSIVTVIADAVATFKPDHILLALRTPTHPNWQERRLVEHIEKRFDLPLTTYTVDLQGHTTTAAGPVLLCFDGSEDAAHAIRRAGELFGGRNALVITAWEPIMTGLGGLGFSGATESMVDYAELDRVAGEEAGHVASKGVSIARSAGLHAEPFTVKVEESVWRTIVEMADRHDAATIVLGSRGLTGLRSMLLGSVSNAVVHHADRPTLIIRRSAND